VVSAVPASRPLGRLAWTALGFNVLVILWGAVVRATGSGAGCGAHWPTCNGVVVPVAPSMGTLIEYSHRATSGIALLLVALLLHQVRRHREPGHLARFWAGTSMVLILSEAAIGAGLVLFEKVARDASTARGFWVAGHLVNTFLLLAALALTAYFVDGAPGLAPDRREGWLRATFPKARGGAGLGLVVVALIATGISGAIAALGDTLFKAGTLGEAIAQDFSPSSHIFLRLRIFHPLIALLSGSLVLSQSYRIITSNPDRPLRRQLGLFLAGLVVAQWFLGLANLVLLAPTGLQILHLLMADLIWMTVVVSVAADRG
jgi:cytochrome c oxidase assembly protein subunit 15